MFLNGKTEGAYGRVAPVLPDATVQEQFRSLMKPIIFKAAALLSPSFTAW